MLPRYSKKQNEAEKKMSNAVAQMTAACEILKHFEDKYGKLNTITIEIRNLVRGYEKKTNEASQLFRDCGGVDVCCKRLDYKNINKNKQ